MFLSILFLPLLVTSHGSVSDMGSSISLILCSVEEIKWHSMEWRIKCSHSWKWSIASESSHVFGDDRRNDSSCIVRCVVSCVVSRVVICGYSGGNRGGGSSGGPFLFSYMLSCKHFH